MFVLLISLIVFCSSAFAAPVTSEDLRCMTDNLYYEAAGEPILGQAMVGHSVINRVKDKRWDDSVCEVIYAKKQYSWTTNPKREIDDLKTYQFLESLAYTLLSNKDSEEATGVTNYLRCDWRKKVDWWKDMTFLGQVGDHCFYRDELR